MSISAVIITLNEENTIARCIGSVEWADEVIVVDSGSSDDTASIASGCGAKVLKREFDNFADQKNFAISMARGEWIFSIDADEIVTPELAEEIKEVIGSGTDKCAFKVNRINNMYGKDLLRFSQPDYNIRLFKKGLCRFVQPVHEYVECDGQAGTLKNAFMHYTTGTFKQHMRKAELYTSFELDIMKKKLGRRPALYLLRMVFNPLLRFTQNYFFLKGMFEGRVGLLISLNAAIAEWMKYYKCLRWSLGMGKDMGREWSEVYYEPAGVAHFIENIHVHKSFLDQLCLKPHSRVLEVGCGSGTMSVFMSHLGSDVTAVDRDASILERAEKASKELNGSVKFMEADAFELPFSDKEFDMAFSQGVLEHFSDEDILKLVREQLRVAKCVFFSVPNNFYRHRDFGNERLMAKREWEALLSAFDIKLSRNYYSIRTKRNLLRSLPIMYMAAIE